MKKDRHNITNDNKSKLRLRINNGFFGFFLTVPALIVLLVVVALPILRGIYVSFCNYTISNINNPVWNNLKNYTKLFEKKDIYGYFITTIVFVALTVIIQTILGLAIALLLNTKLRGRNFFRGLFLIPWTIPSVVVALLWRWMLHQQFGVINYIMYKAGITDTVNVSWTLTTVLAMASIVIASVWKQLPYMMVMLLAGMQSVDASLIEAAKIDGAAKFKLLWHIILPSIRAVMISSIWVAIMNNFQMYTIIFNMTGGGPVDDTTTLSIAAYKAAFQSYDFGKGAAIGVLWLALLLVITIVMNHTNRRAVSDYQ